MKAICEGRKTKAEVVHETIEQYRDVYVRTQQRLDALRAVSHEKTMGKVVNRSLTSPGCSQVLLRRERMKCALEHVERYAASNDCSSLHSISSHTIFVCQQLASSAG